MINEKDIRIGDVIGYERNNGKIRAAVVKEIRKYSFSDHSRFMGIFEDYIEEAINSSKKGATNPNDYAGLNIHDITFHRTQKVTNWKERIKNGI